MSDSRTARIAIELDTQIEPISGRVEAGDEQPRPFRGWTELAFLLEQARAGRLAASRVVAGANDAEVDRS
jgi:hypothetical protein